MPAYPFNPTALELHEAACLSGLHLLDLHRCMIIDRHMGGQPRMPFPTVDGCCPRAAFERHRNHGVLLQKKMKSNLNTLCEKGQIHTALASQLIRHWVAKNHIARTTATCPEKKKCFVFSRNRTCIFTTSALATPSSAHLSSMFENSILSPKSASATNSKGIRAIPQLSSRGASLPMSGIHLIISPSFLHRVHVFQIVWKNCKGVRFESIGMLVSQVLEYPFRWGQCTGC